MMSMWTLSNGVVGVLKRPSSSVVTSIPMIFLRWQPSQVLSSQRVRVEILHYGFLGLSFLVENDEVI